MSIAAFSNQFCPVCSPDKDTLHYMMKCRSCGHVNETPTEQRRRSMARHIITSKHLTVKERQKRRDALNEARRGAAKKAREQKLQHDPRDRPIFGSGRQRTRI